MYSLEESTLLFLYPCQGLIQSNISQHLAYVPICEIKIRNCNYCTNDPDDAINLTVGYTEAHSSTSSHCEPMMGKSVTGINGASCDSFLNA